jgi:ABC-type Zn uptake system ZnuABC Zn-binding protein ZnuA
MDFCLRGRLFISLLVLLTGFLLSCNGGNEKALTDKGLHVVATTAIITDIAKQVAGDDAIVTTVIPNGIDIHGYSPSLGIARDISNADLILVNGYNLEESVLDLIMENRANSAPLVVVSIGLTPLAEGYHHDQGDDGSLVFAEGDPHFWLSVANAMVYTSNIVDALMAVDSLNVSRYRERADAYLDQLQMLDEQIRVALSRIPAERRVLVVYHNAFQYFAADYGFEIEALLPGSPSQAPSATRVAELINFIDARGVAAIYREPQFASKAFGAIARETDVEILLLYSDALPDGINSYIELMQANVNALVEGLSN